MPITIIDFVNSVRSKSEKKEDQTDGRSLLERVRTRQAIKRLRQDHLQGRGDDIQRLLRHAFITLSDHHKRRTSICLKYLLERVDADFLNSKEDGRLKILQFANASNDYDILQVSSHIYIRNTYTSSFVLQHTYTYID